MTNIVEFLQHHLDQRDCYIDPTLVVDILSDPELRKETLIIDVREEDGEYACIKGALHVPFPSILKSLPHIYEMLTAHKLVLVHCEMSHIRGPKSANRIKEFLAEKRQFKWPRVLIIRGGFCGFAEIGSDYCVAPSVWI